MNKNMFDVWFAGLQDAMLWESVHMPVNHGFSKELESFKEWMKPTDNTNDKTTENQTQNQETPKQEYEEGFRGKVFDEGITQKEIDEMFPDGNKLRLPKPKEESI